MELDWMEQQKETTFSFLLLVFLTIKGNSDLQPWLSRPVWALAQGTWQHPAGVPVLAGTVKCGCIQLSGAPSFFLLSSE